MDRRAFLGALSGAFLALPIASEAQPPARVYRVALVFHTTPRSGMVGPPPHPVVRIFLQTLNDLGYVEGRNLILECRSLEGRTASAPTLQPSACD